MGEPEIPPSEIQPHQKRDRRGKAVGRVTVQQLESMRLKRLNPSEKSETENSTALENYIKRGLDMIKDQQWEDVHKHFVSPDKNETKKLGVVLVPGNVIFVDDLLTERDLLIVTRSIAGRSMTKYDKSVEIAHYVVHKNLKQLMETGKDNSENQSLLEFDDDPKHYNPDLVKKLYHDANIVAAEEWLHGLQMIKHSPIAGYEDHEVDVAAYLENQGITLSIDFVTRYQARANWFIKMHPEREQEVREFEKQYGKGL